MVKTLHLNLLQSITRQLGGGRSLEATLPEVLQQIMLDFNAQGIQLNLQNHFTDFFDYPSAYGDPDYFLPSTHAALSAIPAEPLLVTSDLPPETGGVLLAKVCGFEEEFGVLQITTRYTPLWAKEDQQFFQVLADQIGIGLANAQQFRHMKRQKMELEWLHKVGDSLLNLLSTLQIDQVAERIMMATKELLNIEETSIMLKDLDSGDLILWRHTPPERDLSIRLKPGQGVAGWVFEYGKPAIVNDVRQDTRWESAFDSQDGGFKTRSLIAVPIFIDGEVIGVLEALNKKQGEFTSYDQGLLETLATWAAIAIGNANTFDSLKRTSEQLADAKKQAAMAHMVLNLAHKINNAVGAIRVWVMEARDEVGKTPANVSELSGFIDNIMTNTEETLLMVRRIRGATELRTGDMQPINVAEALDSALQFSRLAPSIEIKRQYDDSTPPIGADPERLVEVFLNLLNNAADALGQNGKVILTCRYSQNGMVEVMVQDTGSGIPEHVRNRIFDPFVTSKADGLGLGLWMVKLYVELIGGSVNVSTTSKGTIFRVSLPPWKAKPDDE